MNINMLIDCRGHHSDIPRGPPLDFTQAPAGLERFSLVINNFTDEDKHRDGSFPKAIVFDSAMERIKSVIVRGGKVGFFCISLDLIHVSFVLITSWPRPFACV